LSLPPSFPVKVSFFFHLDKSEAKFGMDLPLLCSTIGVKSNQEMPEGVA
jgi:hypothetical protein